MSVSLETTSICIISDEGTTIWRGKRASTPEEIIEAVRIHAPAAPPLAQLVWPISVLDPIDPAIEMEGRIVFSGG